MERYAIDACSLINAAKNYSMKKETFSSLWKKIDELIESRALISTIEVRDELKDDDLVKWSKKNSQLFLPLREDIQRKATEVLRDFPTMFR